MTNKFLSFISQAPFVQGLLAEQSSWKFSSCWEKQHSVDFFDFVDRFFLGAGIKQNKNYKKSKEN